MNEKIMIMKKKTAKCSECGNIQNYNLRWCQKCEADMKEVGVEFNADQNKAETPVSPKSVLQIVKGKIIFKGHFFEYFLISLGLILLSFVTFGIAIPYFVYWQMKYFVSNLEIEMEK